MSPPLDRADVIAAYRLLLGREPESEDAIEAHRCHASIAALRATILAAPEFRRVARSVLPEAGGGGVATEAEVAAIYRALLGRPPESPAIAQELRAAGTTPVELMQQIVRSEEYGIHRREEAAIAAMQRHPPRRRAAPAAPGRPLRLLLFGAYGNGNLGDTAQAGALARLLAAQLPELRCAASSWIDNEPYDARPAQSRGPDAMLDAEKLAAYDAVVIGGGGMFGPPHFPLYRPEWLHFLTRSAIPYGFAGIGASRGVTEAAASRPTIQALLRGAAFVSVRDAWSVAAVQGLCEGWFEMPDPVLAAWLLLDPPPPADPPASIDTLLIVKAPASGDVAEEALVAAAIRFAQANPMSTRAVMVEPRRDNVLAPHFPGGIEAVTDFAALVRHCAAARLVVSMRYHGAIAGVIAGVPTLAGTAPKARSLLEGLGCPGNAIADAAAFEALLAPHAAAAALPDAAALDRVRAAASVGMRRIAAAIGAAVGRPA